MYVMVAEMSLYASNFSSPAPENPRFMFETTTELLLLCNNCSSRVHSALTGLEEYYS